LADESRLAKLAKLLKMSRKPPKPPRLEELMMVKRRGKTKASERVEPSEVLMRRCELLYRLEPLIFSGVNKLTRRITGSPIYFSNGDEQEIQQVSQWIEEIGLKTLLPHLVKDALIYGFGVAEIVRKNGKVVSLNQLDPKNFDYQREGSDIALTEDGQIKGFVYKTMPQDIELKPEEVLLIRFYTLGEYCLGISPIEAAFKTAWIKLNLEEALGEAVFRHGYPIYYFKIGDKDAGFWADITPEKIKQAKKIIGKVDTATELVLPWWITVDTIRAGDVSKVTDFLEFLSMELLAALEMPKAFGVQRAGLGGRAVEEMDFEKSILAMQEELKRQIEEQLLIPYYKENNFKTRPKLNFAEYAPELQTARLRRLSVYSKYGLLSRTKDLENEIRRREGFPVLPEAERKTDCIFGLGECPVRQEQDLTMDKLVQFCNVCIKRLKKEQEIKGK